MKLLDTDTCVHIIRGNERVLRRRESEGNTVATTWVSACELYFGAELSNAPSEGRDGVERFLLSTLILEFDNRSVRLFGEIKTYLQRSGRLIEDADLFIGAIALANDATLVTGNIRHFERIPGIAIEDWIRG
ncbi:type II toxin-antitoxin system VapC family toxin [bacterium]|nr:type II toxin-antitoxin system VapC family toxin [bacterium]